jgi:hypothetical protein
MAGRQMRVLLSFTKAFDRGQKLFELILAVLIFTIL